MVKEIEPSFERGIAAPAVFNTVKETTGAVPAVPLVIFVIFTARPASRVDAVGATCAPRIEASKSLPCGVWHVAHRLSSNCGPPGWFAPVTKFTLSWHDPQAARVGFVRNKVDWVAPVVC